MHTHLPHKFFKDVSYMPVPLGGGFVKRETPTCREFLNSRSLHFTFVDEVRLRAHDNDRHALQVRAAKLVSKIRSQTWNGAYSIFSFNPVYLLTQIVNFDESSFLY